jgi:pyrimidine-nucleoside phosphorylase
MLIAPLIERKRDGEALSPAEWQTLIEAYTSGRVPDYQMSALLMAVVFRGMRPDELDALLGAMLASGERLAFGPDVPPRVDKHSTGGVGDKVSLVLAPAVAAAGVAVPMMSGRGLGHTGGTLDKLESIPGFRTALSLAEATSQVERLGCALFGQTEAIAPADRKLYALRDATGTVPAVPLIAASILSKKLAEGLDGLVLDVKRGNGAQLQSLDDAMTLGSTMVRLAEAHGCRTVALVTAMDRPLGVACGNALEVREAVASLRGEGPASLRELVEVLGAEMLLVAGAASERDAARARIAGVLDDGRALETFAAVVEAQGGDPGVLEDLDQLPAAPERTIVTAVRGGTVGTIDTRAIGRVVNRLGGGRATVEDTIDPAVGLVMLVEPGDAVEPGTPLVEVHARSASDGAAVLDALASAIVVGERAEPALPLVSHRISAAGATALA